jgi:flagellar hook-associated protein 3
MRITRSMLVENAAYWGAKQLDKLNDAQIAVASGKRINKPSDDPGAYGRIMADRTTLSRYEQYGSNITLAQTWIELCNTTLDAVNSLLQNARDIFTSPASADDGDAGVYDGALSDIYDQVVSYANTAYGSGYMFAGTRSSAPPFGNAVDVSAGNASDLVFGLAGDAAAVTIEITDAGGNLVRTVTASGAAGVNTVSWDGRDGDGNSLADGSYTFTVRADDAGGDSVAAYPIYRGNAGGKEVITGEGSTVTLNANGEDLFGAAIRILSDAIVTLRGSAWDAAAEKAFRSSLQEVIDHLAGEQVALANENFRMKDVNARLEDLTVAVSGRISDLETVDAAEAAVVLKMQETAYEEALAVEAKILDTPTLSDYL